MKFDSPITAAAKRMMVLLETGYLDHKIARDIRTLMEGAMAFEVVSTPPSERSPQDTEHE